MITWDEYRVLDRLVQYLLTSSQERTVMCVLPIAGVSQVVTVDGDVVISAAMESVLVNYLFMMRICLSCGAHQSTVLNVLGDSQP